MKKENVPAAGEEPFSTEVKFPKAELKFLNGLSVELYPDSGMTHSVMGDHYILECRDEEGQVAAIKITFSSVSDESGKRRRYLELTPGRGEPLACSGKDYSFEFKGKGPSFVPRDNNYRINQAMPGRGYTIELEPFFLNCLRLFYEPPYKGSSEIDL